MLETLPHRPSAVEACTERLRGVILDGTFEPGSRLPPERKLAERFGVNRVTVRGALAHLAAEHLVRARQGSGYTVRDYRRSGGPDLIGALIDLAKKPRPSRAITADLLLVRRHLARAVVERIAERDEVDSAAIEEAIDALEEKVQQAATAEEIALADLEVARAFVDASDSDVLRLCMNPVASILARLPRLARAMFTSPEDNVAGWRAAVLALQARVDGLADIVAAQLASADQRTLDALDVQEPEENR
jgi:DNA-binding FadR family transcriptional regulator